MLNNGSGTSMRTEEVVELEREELDSLVLTPILVRKRTASQILTLSSGSSSKTSSGSNSSARRPTKKSKMSLSSLLGSGRISFDEEGLLSNIMVDVEEQEGEIEEDIEEVFEVEAGDSNQFQEGSKREEA